MLRLALRLISHSRSLCSLGLHASRLCLFYPYYPICTLRKQRNATLPASCHSQGPRECPSIESVLTFGFICWYGSLSVSNKKVLHRIVKVCGKVVGEKQLEVQKLYECRVRMKAKAVHEDECGRLIYS